MKITDSHMHLFTQKVMNDIWKHRKNINPKLVEISRKKIERFRREKNQPTSKPPPQDAREASKLWKHEFDKHDIEMGIFFGHYPNCTDLLDFVKMDERFEGYTSLNPTKHGYKDLTYGTVAISQIQ